MYGAGVEPSSLLLRSFISLLHLTCMMVGDDCETVGGMNEWQREKTCASAALSTTDPT
jgi:hypothetical protein